MNSTTAYAMHELSKEAAMGARVHDSGRNCANHHADFGPDAHRQTGGGKGGSWRDDCLGRKRENGARTAPFF